MATAPPEGSFLCIFHFEIPMMFCKAGEDIVVLNSELLSQSSILYIDTFLVSVFFSSLATVSLISKFIENSRVTD